MSGYNVKFGATDAGFSSTVSKVKGGLNGIDNSAKKTSKSFGSSFASMGKAGAAFAAGFGAIKAAMSAVRGTLNDFKEALDMGGTLSDLSARTGETAGNLMLLNRAFDNTGVGSEKVGATLNKLQRSIVEAGRGSAVQERAFRELGLSIADLQYMAPIDQMRAVAGALAGVENDGKRTALAMDILGRSGGELLPLFTNMSAEVANAQVELGALPGVMDRSADAFDSISDKMNVMKGKLTEFAAGMLESAIPALNQFVNAGSSLDAAGFGQQIGQRLAEAFTMITSGDMWEIFRLNGEKAILALQSSDPMNIFAASINALWDKATGSDESFLDAFDRYADAGIEANTEIIDGLDAKLDQLAEKQKKRMADAAKQMAQEEAERAANSGIMLKDIRQKPDSTTTIPETLKRVSSEVKKDSDDVARNFRDAASSMATASVEMAKTKTLADQAWDKIKDAQAANKIDPGGKTQTRIDEALAEGKFGTAKILARRLSRAEEREKNKKLEKEILDKSKGATKKREDEMKPGQGGKTRDEADKGGGGKAKDPLIGTVEAIKKLMEKLEKKLPTHALGA
jgi:hypothetical protein